MLEPVRGPLPPAARAALVELEQRTVQADGGRLKLEWGVLDGRSGDRVDDLLWWQDDRLIGFVGVYGFGGSIELAGMVDPSARRCGVGSALLDAGLALCRERGADAALLVTPRGTPAGAAFAAAHGGTLDHSEYALRLDGPPPHGPTDPDTTVRPATPDDVPDLARILAAAFGAPEPTGLLDRLSSPGERTVVFCRAGRVVGTVRLTAHGGTGGVYGFAVDPAFQGRGIGRDVLRRGCRELFASGALRVGLEVETANEHALGLYTSLGFRPVSTEDYFRVSTG